MAALASIAALGFGSGSQVAGGFLARNAARRDASRIEQAGEFEADRIRRLMQRRLASQRVAFAKAGVDPNTGTALDVAADSAHIAELNALRRQFIFEEEAYRTRQAGNAALVRGIAGGISTILGGAGQLKQLGVIGGGGMSVPKTGGP